MSLAENFQFFSGFSRRSRKRLFCSLLETWRKNLRMTTPSRQVPLETADVVEALLPDVLGDEFRRQRLLLQKLWVDAHHERLLVVAAIEDPNAPALRYVLHAAPQKIVIELF